MIWVTGGSGSGKSAFAEDLLLALAPGPRWYLATMAVWDQEGRDRVERHRLQRAGKGFTTWECPELAPLPPGLEGGVLLEDFTNLYMNQWYGGDPSTATLQVKAWLTELDGRSQPLVVVANQITADGGRYHRELAQFLQALGKLEQDLAPKSQEAYEVLAGIPLPLNHQPRGEREGTAMTLITGGRFQGKEAYGKKLAEAQGATLFPELSTWLSSQNSLEEAKEKLVQALAQEGGLIVCCHELGCGLVPLDREERGQREAVGRLVTWLADRAEVVVRMVCGIPTVIKE